MNPRRITAFGILALVLTATLAPAAPTTVVLAVEGMT